MTASTTPKFHTIPVGTLVSWHYRSAIGHGRIKGIHTLGTNADNTMYDIEEFDHHVSATGSKEKAVVVHSGQALTVIHKKDVFVDLETKIRRVASDAGVAKFHLPKGAVIGQGTPNFKIKHVYVHHSSEPGDESRVVRYVGEGGRQHVRSFPDAESANKYQDHVEDAQLGDDGALAHSFHVINGRIHRISAGEVYTEQPNGRQEKTGILTFNAAGKPVVRKKIASKGRNKYELRGRSFPTIRHALQYLANDPDEKEAYEFEGDRVPLHQAMKKEIDKHMRSLGPDEPRVTPSGLKIPPGLKNVEVATDPNYRVQFRGVNDIGKMVPGYSTDHITKQDVNKFERLKTVSRVIPKLDKALTPEELRDNPTAAAVYLMRHGGARVDSGGKKSNTVKGNETFGASSVEARHVTVNGNTVTFKFPGKDNTPNTYKFRDPEYAVAMANHLRGKRGRDKVFKGVTSAKTQKYIQRHTGMTNIKNHDLRTHLATAMAADMVRNTGPRQMPKTEREYAKARREIGATVATQLNQLGKRTRTLPDGTKESYWVPNPLQALNKYIDPAVLEPLRANITDDVPKKTAKKVPTKKTTRKKK